MQIAPGASLNRHEQRGGAIPAGFPNPLSEAPQAEVRPDPMTVLDVGQRAAVSGRIPPHNLDAEEALLGAMLLSRDAIATATQRLKASDFYRPAHGQIFDAISTLYMVHGGDMPDVTTVAEELRRNGALETSGGKQNLLRLQAMTPASTNAAHYAEIVDDLAALRRLIAVSNEINTLGYEGATDVEGTLDRAEGLMFQVAQRRLVDTLMPLNPLLEETIDHLERLFSEGETDEAHPRTGFYDLDDALQGLRRQALIVLAARPGQGKTSLALGIASNVAIEQKLPVLFFSMEMGRNELAGRILSAESRVNSSKFRKAQFQGPEWTAIQQAAGRLSEAPIYLDDNPRSTVLDMTTKARRLASRDGGLGLIVVDYLQLMSSPRAKENRQVEVAELSRGLKVLARELDCPVLALSQLNRSLEYRQDKRPMLADLRESGAIEQDADAVLFIYRDDAYNDDSEAKNLAEIIIAKNRHGPTGKANLLFRGECTMFENYTGQV